MGTNSVNFYHGFLWICCSIWGFAWSILCFISSKFNDWRIHCYKVLCKSYPAEFASYLHYCHSLTFDQRPDYGFLKRIFRDLFTREGTDCLIKSLYLNSFTIDLIQFSSSSCPNGSMLCLGFQVLSNSHKNVDGSLDRKSQ